jgi:tRNA-modifying protein YgfZ
MMIAPNDGYTTMRKDWKALLEDRGAEFEGDRVASFGNPDLERRMVLSGDIVADLSGTGLIAAQGDDAAAFLQGQLTNDVREVSEQHSQLSAYCSPKGRALALLRISRRKDVYYLAVANEVLEASLKRLRMFVLRSRVALENVREEFVRIGVSGPRVERDLLDLLGAVPTEVDASAQIGGLSVIRVRGPHPRFEILSEDLDAMEKTWTALNARTAPVGDAPWRLLDIRAGVPRVYPETADVFVPQMINLNSLDAVSFSKGCYTGQEVVARMQYLGKLKRRMYRAQVDTDLPPRPGDALFAPDSAESVGKVVVAAPAPDGGHELLAVIQTDSAEGGGLRLHGASGPPVAIRGLPYMPGSGA